MKIIADRTQLLNALTREILRKLPNAAEVA
jgi:hypothetical protein